MINKPTEAQVEAAAKTYPRWIVDHDGPEVPWEKESEALENEYRAMMRAALEAAARAAQGAAPPVNSFDTTAERVKNGADSLHAPPVLPSSGVDEDALAEVLLQERRTWEEHGSGSSLDLARAVIASRAEWLKEQG